MRINNPVKFTKGNNANSADNALVTVGEVKSLYKEEYSADGLNWHNDVKNNNDSLMRVSFDGGNNYPLKFSSYINDEIILKNEDGELFNWPTTTGTNSLSIILRGINEAPILSSIVENYPDRVFSQTENGNRYLDFILPGFIKGVSLIRQEPDGHSYLEITDGFVYNFIQDNDENDGNIKLQYYFNSQESSNQYKYFIKIKLNLFNINSGSLISGFKVPVYSSTVQAVPTVTDEEIGVCNYLDKTSTSLNSFTCLTRFVNITRLSLYISSEIAGNISLTVKFGNNTVNVVKPVTTSESWIYIENSQLSSGEITVTRNDDSSDTLSSACIVTGIRVESE